MSRRLVVVVITALLALGGSVVQAPPSSACLIPCNVQPKAAGTLLGGGIPDDGFFGFTFSQTFKGVEDGAVVTKSVSISGGGYYPGYGSVTLGSDYFAANVTLYVVPGITGAPSLAVVTIQRNSSSTNNILGFTTGLLNGSNSAGALTVFMG